MAVKLDLALDWASWGDTSPKRVTRVGLKSVVPDGTLTILCDCAILIYLLLYLILHISQDHLFSQKLVDVLRVLLGKIFIFYVEELLVDIQQHLTRIQRGPKILHIISIKYINLLYNHFI